MDLPQRLVGVPDMFEDVLREYDIERSIGEGERFTDTPNHRRREAVSRGA